MRRGLLALGLAAGLAAGWSSPAAAAGGGAAKIPAEMTCPDRESAVSGGAWTCVLLLDADGNPTTPAALEKAFRATKSRPRPLSYSPGTVSSDWTWSYNEVVYYGINPSPGQIGSIRITASINLNGRQAQSAETIVRFSGASVSLRADQSCKDDNAPTWLPNIDCGTTRLASSGYTNSKLTNYQQPYLSNDHRYWFEYYYAWKPQGYSDPDYSDGFWRLANQPAMSAAFSCDKTRPASRVCVFG